jgi:hypothetical protein
LKEEGMAIAMKGEVDDEEIRLLTEAEGARYRLRKSIPQALPFTLLKRTTLLFQKRRV